MAASQNVEEQLCGIMEALGLFGRHASAAVEETVRISDSSDGAGLHCPAARLDTSVHENTARTARQSLCQLLNT